MPSAAVLQEAQKLHNVSDRLESLADLHPPVSEALLSISGNVRHIAAILEAAGSSLDKIVSATIVLAEEDDFAGMNEEWLRWFPSNPPARQGAKLPARVPGLKVSIAAIAET